MTDALPQGPSPSARRLAAAAGTVMAVSFFGLSQTPAGLQYDFHGPWNKIPAAELQFWLGHMLLFLPGLALIGWSVWPERWPTYRAVADRARTLSDAAFVRIAAVATAAWVCLAVVGRLGVLRGLPMTDDENAVRFGGKLLATGRAWVEAPPLIDQMPNAYLYLWEGRLASFDWLGSQIAWAVSELVGFPWPWPILAAAPLLASGWVARQRVGEGYGAATMVVLALSPMFTTLSFTTHAHVLSRGFVALFLASWVMAHAKDRVGWWVLTGACVAAATLCRPFESAAILSPFAIWTVVALLRGQPWARRATIGMAVPLVFAAGAWLVHQHAITGQWGTTTRSPDTPNSIPWRIIPIPASASFTDPMRLWSRFGGNFAYNLLMLVVFFGGPIGAALVALGIRASTFSRALAIGVAMQLALALFHDDAGIHAVGPIHYSEVAPFLALLAAFGLRELLRKTERFHIERTPFLTALTTAYLVGSVFFVMWMSFNLRRQADVQAAIHEVVAEARLEEPSVLVAPEFHEVFKHHPDWNRTAAWVLRWPPASPDLTDGTIYVHDSVSPEQVRTAYPDRRIYQMKLLDDAPWVSIHAVNP